MLTILLSLFTFFSCQQVQETTLLSAQNIVLQARVSNPQSPDPAPPTASNIIFKSVDGGQTWQDISDGLPKDLMVRRVFADEGKIFLTSENSMYHSNSAAAISTWDKELVFGWDNVVFFGMLIEDLFHGRSGPYISSYPNGFFQKVPGTDVLNPLHNTLVDKSVRSVLETSDGAVFVGCESGIYKSIDGTKTWKMVYSEMSVSSLVSTNGVLVCITSKDILRSTDNGEHWDSVLREKDGFNKIISVEGGFIALSNYVKPFKDGQEHGMMNRLYSSVDLGKTWQRLDEGFSVNPFSYAVDKSLPKVQAIYDIEHMGKTLFCSTEAGIFRSSDQGKTWEFVFRNAGKKRFNLAVSGQVIYAVPSLGGC